VVSVETREGGMGQQEVSAREQGPYSCTKMRPSGGRSATCKAPRLPCPLGLNPAPAHQRTLAQQACSGVVLCRRRPAIRRSQRLSGRRHL